MSRNILFVLEGGRAEPRFLGKMVTLLRTQIDYEMFSYRTNLHKMLDGMFIGDKIDTDLDFVEYLRSCKTNPEDVKVLSNKFSDIFLFFDMDPQDQNYDIEKVRKALVYFNDSTENGKLYINYPMFESFRHISNLDDLSYLDMVVMKKDIRRYKEIVNKEGLRSLSDISKIDEQTMLKIALLNLRKANMIIENDNDIPDIWHYENAITQVKAFERQSQELQDNEKLFVLNTCIFNIIDYNPTTFYERISKLET